MWEKNALTDIHQSLLNIYGDQTVDVGTVRWWVVCFSCGNSNKGSPFPMQVFTNQPTNQPTNKQTNKQKTNLS